jgi:hypothetical protein
MIFRGGAKSLKEWPDDEATGLDGRSDPRRQRMAETSLLSVGLCMCNDRSFDTIFSRVRNDRTFENHSKPTMQQLECLATYDDWLGWEITAYTLVHEHVRANHSFHPNIEGDCRTRDRRDTLQLSCT